MQQTEPHFQITKSIPGKTFLKAPESGDYLLKLEAIGGRSGFKIFVNNEWKVVGESEMREGSQWLWDSIIPTQEGMGIRSAKITLEKGNVYPIVVYGMHIEKEKDMQIRMAWITPSQKTENYNNALAKSSESRKSSVLHA